MASPIYDAMNQNNEPRPVNGNFDMVKQFGSFKQDPFGFMMKRRGINIPSEYRNDPQAAVQYLLNSGQMTQEQLTYIQNVARNMGINF